MGCMFSKENKPPKKEPETQDNTTTQTPPPQNCAGEFEHEITVEELKFEVQTPEEFEDDLKMYRSVGYRELLFEKVNTDTARQTIEHNFTLRGRITTNLLRQVQPDGVSEEDLKELFEAFKASANLVDNGEEEYEETAQNIVKYLINDGAYEPIVDKGREHMIGAGRHEVMLYRTTKKHPFLPPDMLLAAKVYNRIFDNLRVTKRILRELRISRILQKHPNITAIKDIKINHNGKQDLQRFDSMIVLFELMDGDIKKEHLRKRDPKIYYSEADLKSVMKQLLLGLKHMHAGNFVHRDLKSPNILVKRNPDYPEKSEVKYCAKLADFDLSKCYQKVDMEGIVNEPVGQVGAIAFQQKKAIRDRKDHTKAVVTWNYRSPEVSLINQSSGQLPKIDIWAMACVFLELMQMIQGNDVKLHRNTFFRGSKDGLNFNRQLARWEPDYTLIEAMMEKLGSPPLSWVNSLRNEETREFILEQGKKEPVNFQDYFPKSDPACLDLVKRMLKYNPEDRLSVEECLAHPYLADAAVFDDSHVNIDPHRDELETMERLEEAVLREAICAEVLFYNKDEMKRPQQIPT